MKIAVVVAHFIPELGYQEVNLAHCYAKLGNTVRIFCSNLPSISARDIISDKYAVGDFLSAEKDFSITRLKATLSFGANVFCRELKRAVLSFNPDVVIVIGVGKIFPLPVLLAKNKRTFHLVALFSDIYKRLDLKRKLIRILRYPVTKLLFLKSLNTCDKLIFNTLETEKIFSQYFKSGKHKKILDKKTEVSTLGFDEDKFCFMEKDRLSFRKELNVQVNDCLLITSTRINKSKQIETILDAVFKLKKEGFRIKYILIGFVDNEYGKSLKLYIKKKDLSDKVFCFPIMSQAEIKKYYSAADIGIWIQPAISIQQAMGTGLPVIIQDLLSLKHLVRQGFNGWYFMQPELPKTIGNAIAEHTKLTAAEQLEKRKQLEVYNLNNLSYKKIAQKILENL